jgi:hypothetical protein
MKGSGALRVLSALAGHCRVGLTNAQSYWPTLRGATSGRRRRCSARYLQHITTTGRVVHGGIPGTPQGARRTRSGRRCPWPHHRAEFDAVRFLGMGIAGFETSLPFAGREKQFRYCGARTALRRWRRSFTALRRPSASTRRRSRSGAMYGEIATGLWRADVYDPPRARPLAEVAAARRFSTRTLAAGRSRLIASDLGFEAARKAFELGAGVPPLSSK